MPLVRSLAHRHARRREDYDDLVQVGSIGLLNAIDRFDLDRGGDLPSFAAPTITGEIKRHLRDRASTVRLPRGMAELRARLAAARDELTPRLGRSPSADELASEMGADPDEVARLLSPESNPEPGALPAESELADALGEGFDAAEDRVVLAAALERLDERERRIVALRFLQDLPQEQVARELGISRRHLSRQTEATLSKLRRAIEAGQRPLPPRRAPPKMTPMEVVGPPPVDSQYLDQPYHIVIAREGEEGWTARVEELRGCEARGATYEEAARGIRVAMEKWIANALQSHREVPAPRAASSHSGKLMLRMPQSLHAELARAAEREEVSLNQFITSSLASTVGWGGNATEASEEPTGTSDRSWLRRAMVANLVVLGLAAVAAVALLIVALTHGL